MQQADKSKEGQQGYRSQDSYVQFVKSKVQDEKNGLLSALSTKLEEIVGEEILDDLRRTGGMTESDLKEINVSRLLQDSKLKFGKTTDFFRGYSEGYSEVHLGCVEKHLSSWKLRSTRASKASGRTCMMRPWEFF